MSNRKITIQLHPCKYGTNNLTNAILTKNFGFELEIASNIERNRTILTLDEVTLLKSTIDKALKDYESYTK
jgi:hypothetical protein